MENEIGKLNILVNVVANKIASQVKQGKLNELQELLWNVPVNILAEFAKRVNND